MEATVTAINGSNATMSVEAITSVSVTSQEVTQAMTQNTTESMWAGFTFKPGTAPFIILMNVIPIFTIVIGLIGNCITIFVFTKKENRTSSSAILFIALAASDICILMVNIFPGWMMATFPEVVCIRTCGVDFRLLSYFRMIFLELSSWIVAWITFERVVCVVFPLKARRVTQPKFAIVVSGSTICCLALTNTMYFYLSYSVDEVHRQILIWVNNVTEFILPASIILTGNVVIWVGLHRQRARMGSKGGNSEERTVTIRLILVSVTYMVTMTPSFIYDVMWAHEALTYDQIWRDGLASISNMNAAINFYLYVLQGRRFRAQVKASLACFVRMRGTMGRQSELSATTLSKVNTSATSLASDDDNKF